MKFTILSYISVIQTSAIIATTLTDPPIKTVTEILTVTYTPTETKPIEHVVTQTLYHESDSTLAQVIEGDFVNLTPNSPIREFINRYITRHL